MIPKKYIDKTTTLSYSCLCILALSPDRAVRILSGRFRLPRPCRGPSRGPCRKESHRAFAGFPPAGLGSVAVTRQQVPSFASLRHYLLTSSSLSPLAATFTGPSRICCKQKTYVRLTSHLNPLAATPTKNTRAGSSLVFQCSNAFQRVSSSYLLSFQILAHSLARRKTQPFCFQSIPHSLPKNTRGGGSALASLFLLGRSLQTGLGVSSSASPFNLQLSTVNPPLGHLFHGSRNTDHAPPRYLPNSLPVPKPCIGRTIGGGSLLRQAIPRSQFRRFQVRLLRGRVRWVSFLVVGSSSSRASPFFVPTNN